MHLTNGKLSSWQGGVRQTKIRAAYSCYRRAASTGGGRGHGQRHRRQSLRVGLVPGAGLISRAHSEAQGTRATVHGGESRSSPAASRRCHGSLLTRLGHKAAAALAVAAAAATPAAAAAAKAAHTTQAAAQPRAAAALGAVVAAPALAVVVLGVQRAGAHGQRALVEVHQQRGLVGEGARQRLQARGLHVVHHNRARRLVVAGRQAVVCDEAAHHGVHLQCTSQQRDGQT